MLLTKDWGGLGLIGTIGDGAGWGCRCGVVLGVAAASAVMMMMMMVMTVMTVMMTMAMVAAMIDGHRYEGDSNDND